LCAGAVASELVVDSDEGVVGVEVGDGESECFTDAQAAGEEEFD
jgi:hypothetical protein